MIYELEGDILLIKAQAVAHGVSPNDHFDVGLALAPRELWLGMAKDSAITPISRIRIRANSGRTAAPMATRTTT